MAKKTKKTRTVSTVQKDEVDRKEIKKKLSYYGYMVVAVIAIIVILALAVNFYAPSQLGNGGTAPVVSGITQSGGRCTANTQCFVVSCRSTNVLECVNTSQMESYYKNCNGVSDVKVEFQNFTKCSCTQNYCRTP